MPEFREAARDRCGVYATRDRLDKTNPVGNPMIKENQRKPRQTESVSEKSGATCRDRQCDQLPEDEWEGTLRRLFTRRQASRFFEMRSEWYS
jgi:hypothetical protein